MGREAYLNCNLAQRVESPRVFGNRSIVEICPSFEKASQRGFVVSSALGKRVTKRLTKSQVAQSVERLISVILDDDRQT